MKRILLALSLISGGAFAASPWIWGADNMAENLAPKGFYLADGKQYISLTVDPSDGLGVAAPVGSVGVRNDSGVGELWVKSGTADTAWTKMGSGGGAWSLLGNGGTDASTDFLGTTDAVDLVFRTDDTERLRITASGDYDTTLGVGLVHSDSSGLLSSSLLVDADVDAAAAIAGTKISPDFGSQNIETTGDLTAANVMVGGTVEAPTQLNLVSQEILLFSDNDVSINAMNTRFFGDATFDLGLLSKGSILLEDPGAGTNAITLNAPTLSSGWSLTLPADDGDAGECLKTNGSGVTDWGACSTSVGDVVGPASSTDNAIARFDTTTGKLIQNSVGILSDTGELSGLTQLDVDNVRIDGNTVSSTSGNLNLDAALEITAQKRINVGNIDVAGALFTDVQVDGVTTGTNATLPAPTRVQMVSTDSSLISISGITASESQLFVWTNYTTRSVTFVNTPVPNGSSILTGTGADIIVPHEASAVFAYISGLASWVVVSAPPPPPFTSFEVGDNDVFVVGGVPRQTAYVGANGAVNFYLDNASVGQRILVICTTGECEIDPAVSNGLSEESVNGFYSMGKNGAIEFEVAYDISNPTVLFLQEVTRNGL